MWPILPYLAMSLWRSLVLACRLTKNARDTMSNNSNLLRRDWNFTHVRESASAAVRVHTSEAMISDAHKSTVSAQGSANVLTAVPSAFTVYVSWCCIYDRLITWVSILYISTCGCHCPANFRLVYNTWSRSKICMECVLAFGKDSIFRNALFSVHWHDTLVVPSSRVFTLWLDMSCSHPGSGIYPVVWNHVGGSHLDAQTLGFVGQGEEYRHLHHHHICYKCYCGGCGLCFLRALLYIYPNG